MISRTITVTNETGLHSRPADLFVRTARLYTSRITVVKNGQSADAKNIIKVILLNVPSGATITIEADGEDAQEAVEDLTRLVVSNFTTVNTRIEI